MDLWEKFSEEIKDFINVFPEHSKIIDLLCSHTKDNLPNILLYGEKGFPKDELWYIAAIRTYGHFTKKECIWNKEWTYYETPFFFEIDFSHPAQPKDASSLCDFLKEIIVHSSIHVDRHIFILKNIEILCIRGYVGMLRVLLERFSHNVWFICTSEHIGKVESPIRSRFMTVRVKSTEPDEIREFLSILNKPIIEKTFEGPYRSNLYFHYYVSTLYEKNQNISIDQICSYYAPFLPDMITKTPTIEQIRSLTQKLCIHGFTFQQIAYDMLHHIPEELHMDWIAKCTEIDHMCALTDGYRKPLYVEYILNTALYNDGSIDKRT